jgi:hypothetical protein
MALFFFQEESFLTQITHYKCVNDKETVNQIFINLIAFSISGSTQLKQVVRFSKSPIA